MDEDPWQWIKDIWHWIKFIVVGGIILFLCLLMLAIAQYGLPSMWRSFMQMFE